MMILFTLCLSTLFCTVLGAAPGFTGATYPLTVNHDEGGATPSGTVFHTFTATDADGVNPMLSYTWVPSNSYLKFAVTEANPSAGTTTAQIALAPGHVLDYETQAVYQVYVNAFDGVEYAPDEVLLTISVGDVGEAPVLVPAITFQKFFMNESQAGYKVGDPAYTISDGDSAETHTWNITGGTAQSYLNVISTNGSVYVISDYDLENSAPNPGYIDVSVTDRYGLSDYDLENSAPNPGYIDVSVTERYGLSTTLTYSVTVYDINDNAPIFNPTVYNITCNQTTALLTELTTFTVTDADVTFTNNVYNYTLQQVAVAEYFKVEYDKLLLRFTFDITNGNGPYSFLVYATDTGTPALTATATVSIWITDGTTTTQSTTTAVTAKYDYGSEGSTIWLTILACFIAACIIGYILVLSWRWNTFGQCLPRSCPNNRDCRLGCDECCTCCHGDEDEELIVGADDLPIPYVVGEKKGPLGFEANLNKDKGRY